ncbi:hypothetical protein C6P45_000728 [Maudiozyma exigua]|uniref:Transport and Golgi organization protein 2 n=1 Tax=Maudiozyma exigua TaxID=34358 RepID=A0A9P6W736_MAUEX|nr:hypothetical protein C6P45_000728 [Kazachstania exigua]
MCILFATRSHPNYELILISNRDEFFERDTHNTCWHTNSSILSPYDMARNQKTSPTNSETFGTWIGINKNGRVANILNLRPADTPPNKSSKGKVSRGMIPFTFLNTDSRKDSFSEWDSFEKFEHQYPCLTTSGDFNFFYGDIKSKSYRIIDTFGQTFKVLDQNDNDSFVLSNNTFNIENTKKWNKTEEGMQKLKELISKTKNESNNNIILMECFKLASICSVPEEIRNKPYHVDPAITYDTIFVPPLGSNDGEDIGLTITKGDFYGTRSQIVILVSKNSKHVTYVEKVLHTSDRDCKTHSAINPKDFHQFEFEIE